MDTKYIKNCEHLTLLLTIAIECDILTGSQAIEIIIEYWHSLFERVDNEKINT